MRILSKIAGLLFANWLTILGAVGTSVAACSIVLALAAELVNPLSSPYTAAFLFLIMPGFFLGGLTLLLLGVAWERHRNKERAAAPTLEPLAAAWRTILADPTARGRFVFVVAATVLNIAIVGAVGQRGLSFMDSPQFCGTLCHSVMEPEHQAYLRSPHARVACVTCHIGSGASWAVKSKLSGLRQIWHVAMGTYHRPIPSPVPELRPSRDTCEQCHWPARFQGNRLALFVHYRDDAANTPEVNALLLKVGGADPKAGEYRGIHRHVSADLRISFAVLDDRRERIGAVTVSEPGKADRVYLPAGDVPPTREERVMDCIDCHNRPSHIFAGSPGQAVDRALAQELIDVSIPFVRSMAVTVLAAEDIARDDAEAVFTKRLSERYAADHPDVSVAPAALSATGAALAALYRQNIFPPMRIGWDTYPSHLGHRGLEVDARGCFRCHDDQHQIAGGAALSQDCDLCHEVLADGEAPDALPSYLRALLFTAR